MTLPTVARLALLQYLNSTGYLRLSQKSVFPLPTIAHVIVDGSLLHYVVIHKISKKQVVIADPAKGIVKKTPEDFFKAWTGILILLVPAQTFQKGKETKNIFEHFWGLLLPQKRLVLDIFVASLVVTVLGILGVHSIFRSSLTTF